jgi:1-acyl-sn-glycerol-3-phosphate acyltransferase
MIVTPSVRVFAGLRTYGKERVPLFGGAVIALNHFSWLDPAAFGSASPRTLYYLAKSEAHEVTGLGQLIRAFGTFSVRRGESDREAVRMMRRVVREGKLLGLFVEGTRQRSGVPGEVKSGAAMVAVQEEVPVVSAAIYGTHDWRLFRPITVVWGEPMRFDGLSKNARGYREGSAEIERELQRLWRFARDLHQAGRPRVAVPPR